jgi:hypothetical protein
MPRKTTTRPATIEPTGYRLGLDMMAQTSPPDGAFPDHSVRAYQAA